MEKKWKQSYVILMAAVFWILGICALVGTPRAVQAANLSSYYNQVMIDGKDLPLTSSLPVKGSASGSGNYEIYENDIYFRNYTGRQIYIAVKPGRKLNLYFLGSCKIDCTDGKDGIVLIDSPHATITIAADSPSRNPSLTINTKRYGIYSEYVADKTTLEIKGSGSYKTDSLTIKANYTGICVKGKMDGVDSVSLLQFKNIMVNVKSATPLIAYGRHYKNSAYQEGITLSEKAGIYCISTLAPYCADHAPWVTDAPKSNYYEYGNYNEKRYALTPLITTATLNTTESNPLSGGKLVSGKKFPDLEKEDNECYVSNGILKLKRNGTEIHVHNLITDGGVYEAQFQLIAEDGHGFSANIPKSSIKVPTGMTVTDVQVKPGKVSSSSSITSSTLLFTVTASSPPLIASEVRLTDLKLPASGNSSASPTVKSGSQAALVVSREWRTGGGTLTTAPFKGGDKYIFHVVMAPGTGYSLGNKTKGVNKVYINGKLHDNILITFYTSGQIAIDCLFYADSKITFNMQGHGSAIAPQFVKYNEKAAKPADPTAAGYRFLGWGTSPTSGSYFNFDQAITKDVTLYAIWKQEIKELKQLDLTSTVKQISAGASAATAPDLKAGDMDSILQLLANWATSTIGTTFKGTFADGETYYLYCHVDTVSSALFTDPVAVTFNGKEIPSQYIYMTSGGRTLYAAIPYTAHVWPLKEVSQEADCEAEGYKSHYECTGCGKWFTSAEGDTEITDKSAYTIPATGHEWGDWEMDPNDGDLHYRYCKRNPAHAESEPHKFVKTEDTSKRTTTYTCSVCGYKTTFPWEDEPAPEIPDDTPIPPDDAPPAEKEDTIITEDIKDKELDIARFHLLQLRYKSITDNSITLVWNKVDGAKSYYVYGSLCGQDYKKLKKIKAGSKLQYTQKKLKKGKYYKYLVTAVTSYKKKAVVIAASKTVHLATTGGKVGNYKSVKLTNITGGKLTIKKGKTFKIKATPVPASKKLTVKQHRKLCYESSNQKIATVTAKGTIKAKKKGTCVIYIYAQSGKFGKIKVTVK